VYYNTNITLPQEIVLSLREISENIVKDMKRSVAVKYYKENKLSLGQCAELAEMSKEDFIQLLSSYKISIFNFDNDEELLEDIKNA
jgi:predicted HTH domain antitoxin